MTPPSSQSQSAPTARTVAPGARPWLAAWLPVLLFEALVLYVSSRPNLQLPSGVPYLDKVAHFGEYAALGGLLYRALRLSGGWKRESALSAILAVALLGAGDETFQRQIPGRFSSALDWLADLLGGISGALVALGIEHRWAALFRAGGAKALAPLNEVAERE